MSTDIHWFVECRTEDGSWALAWPELEHPFRPRLYGCGPGDAETLGVADAGMDPALRARLAEGRG